MARDGFFSLVPERIKFSQFWIEIRKRNLWLIKLRYGAVVMLSFLISGLMILNNTDIGFDVNTVPLWIITFSIMIYNLIFHKAWTELPKIKKWIQGEYASKEKKGFHSLHFSLIQIIFDLIALLFFIYFTGGVESPLYIFFIFHVILGSLFLPQQVIGTIVACILAVSIGGSVSEFMGIIPHHPIKGLLNASLYNNPGYMLVFFTTFGITLYVSIYLTNSIARDLYQRERALTKAYTELENAEKTKSKYVQTVVHDLKTPIAAAVTYLNMILDKNLGDIPESHQKPLERSKARLSGAIQTINDILQISQLKIESSVENIEKVNIDEVFNEILQDLSPISESKRLDIVYKCDSSNPEVEVEPKLIKLSLANLISNAVKYTEYDGKIELILRDSKDNLEISVCDNGIGIPKTEQEKIFQSFYRSSVSKQKGIEGTGLGMSIVWEVIHKYHGHIELISPSYLGNNEDRPGTQFILQIPKRYSVIG